MYSMEIITIQYKFSDQYSPKEITIYLTVQNDNNSVLPY